MTKKFDGLSVGLSIAQQQKNVSEFTKDPSFEDISELLARNYPKNCWENAARIVVALETTKLIGHLTGLLEWLQDRNWPGAELIFSRLVPLNCDSIEKAISNARSIALAEGDMDWLENLDQLYRDMHEQKIG